MRQRINRIKLGSAVGRHKTEQHTDSAGTQYRADNRRHRKRHGKIFYQIIKQRRDGKGNQHPNHAAD